MSGQLVGEVIAASDLLRGRGLSRGAFHALIAIAEKAETHSRQGSVRWDHIRAALYSGKRDKDSGELQPASKRFAERAIHDLTEAGVIRVVKKGFKNTHSSRAPIYEIQRLLDSDTQVSVPNGIGTDVQVSEPGHLGTDKSGVGYRHWESSYRHSDVVLDGSIDVPLDRAAIRSAIDRCPRCDQAGRLDDLSDCPEHPNFRQHPELVIAPVEGTRRW